MSPVRVHPDPPAELEGLRTSARGWHGVQLAVLGFIGLCGALQGEGASDDPSWLQQLSFWLVVLSLVLACAATALVANAAWPVYGGRVPLSATDEAVHTGRRLRAGITLTFLAVATLAVATSSAWWPSAATRSGDLVELSTVNGSICGTLVPADEGTVAVEASGQRFVVPSQEVVRLAPADSCPG